MNSQHWISDINWESSTHRGTIRQITLGGLGLFGFVTVGTNKKDGKKTKLLKAPTLAELRTKLAGAFPQDYREVPAGEHEADAAEREQLQAMLDADELPVGLRGRAATLGLKAAPNGTELETAGPTFTPTDDAVFLAWMNREPQREFFSGSHPRRKQHNMEQVVRYVATHRDAPLTLPKLDRAFAALDAMQCIQREGVIHRAAGPNIGGHAKTYDHARDPSLAAPRRYTEAELLAASKKFPMGMTITLDRAVGVLGDEALARAVCDYWANRKV
ncbi:MAG TPA: hypothetical protein VK728_09950 [Candidatus Sulfotelmatobacter sp.]|jgi:hypothetical protein|nr:hypothetical protein [Candidatus Sulfotelmatobacter sp.]